MSLSTETTILSDRSNETKHELISPKYKQKDIINYTSSSQTTISTSPYIPELDPEGPYFSEYLINNFYGSLNLFPYSFYGYNMGNLY